MTREILPPAHWGELAGTDLGTVLPLCDPSRTTVLVVRDGELIAGQWSCMEVPHLEGVGIHPDYRKRASVARHLWLGMREIVNSRGATVAITHAIDPEIHRLMVTAGAIRLEGTPYAVPMMRKR